MERQAKAARRGRGRPRGTTEQGLETRRHLYDTALGLIADRGFAETTLRDIAKKAKVSVGLLYRYFPSKNAIVLALYDELSAEYAARAVKLEAGSWRERFLFALRTSLDVLGPHRGTLRSLVSIIVSTEEDGLFAPGTAFSRERVQSVFIEAVRGATDAPKRPVAEALGRLLYIVHLAVLMWWLLDRSPAQHATSGLVSLLERLLLPASLALKLPGAGAFVRTADALSRQGFFGEQVSAGEQEGES